MALTLLDVVDLSGKITWDSLFAAILTGVFLLVTISIELVYAVKYTLIGYGFVLLIVIGMVAVSLTRVTSFGGIILIPEMSILAKS